MSSKSHSLGDSNVNFLFHSIGRDISNNKGLSETDRIFSEATNWRNILNGTIPLEKHDLKACDDIYVDWNERLHNTNSSNSISSISEIVFQQDKGITDDSQYLRASSGHSLDSLSLNKHEESKTSKAASKQRNQSQFTSVASATQTTLGCNTACEIFSDWTQSSDSSETQAGQASLVTLTSDWMSSEGNPFNSSLKYPVRRSRPDCIYYLKTGKCSYGTKCKYNHPPRDQTLVRALSRRECFDFLQFGSCPYGKKCKYNHPDRPLTERNNVASGSVVTGATRHDRLKQKSSGLKSSGTHCQRTYPMDPSLLDSDEFSSMWDKEKRNKVNFDDVSFTPYHLWDSISVFDSSLRKRVPDNTFRCVETKGDVQRGERRHNLPDSFENRILDDAATELPFQIRRSNHISRRVTLDPSFFEDSVGHVSNAVEHSSQFFSTPSVELLEANEKAFHSGKQNMDNDESQSLQDEADGTSDFLTTLSSMFSSCSMQWSECSSMDRIYS
ncbi:hypothetical protein GpartN1_g1426.t1 [Galdieria partita]|uniref:C3H1-type domain-containing protein n=1 Tax=Galdieria partita TaxID=83374 RepID=A0A9C7PSC4_9RHOD|nr:hypothetical protein GpartN1_g1426.t1 [Galdieria partita]